jgi:hypothetical protein
MLQEFCKQLDRMGLRSIASKRSISARHYYIQQDTQLTHVFVGGGRGASIWYFKTGTGEYVSHRTESM